MMKVVVLEEHYLHTNFHSKQLKTLGARCPIYWFFWHFLSSWPCDENEKSSSVGLCRCHWANQIPKPLPDSTNPLGEDVTWNRLPPKNTFFGRGSAHNGRSMPILRKTQLHHDINLPPKFYQDLIKTHGAMLGTDRQTHTHTHNEFRGHFLTREPKRRG